MKWILICCLLLAGCASNPPSTPDDVCAIFDEKHKWYKKARKSTRRWGTGVPVLMAFAHQESGFRAKARPPRRKIFGFIPWRRPASAFGFAQAIDETWSQYKKSTGHWGADRDDFADAMDFVGWYNDQSFSKSRIKKTDTYNLYLAYHEGQGGFQKGTYKKKTWLTAVARKVANRADLYRSQLKRCEKKLKRGWFLRLFS